jgi:hypothetical protein
VKEFVCFLFAAAFSAGAASQPITLVDNGKSSYSIRISTKASPSERRGAEEFQHFIQEMSGARLPIMTGSLARNREVVIGGDQTALGPEEFRLQTVGRKLIISGGHQRGAMYGVYALLEKLGCRWFTSEVSRIPKTASIVLPPLDETQKPAFEYREPFFTEAFEKNWAARNKMNGNSSALDASTGGKVQYYPFVHSAYEMIPPGKFFKDHPEYFALVDGRRRSEHAQLCLTHPDVLRLGVEAVERWIREHPEATIISVSQNDWEGWCECDQCRRVEQEEGGEHSGPLLRYVNAVAGEIGKRHPDKLIDTLAYWYTERPPAKVRPAKNVRIRLCPIGACEAHPYEKCERDAYFMKNLRAWAKITNQLYIWHYNTNFVHYLIPFPDFDELAADIPMYQRNGVVGLFMQGNSEAHGGGENAELRSYVIARLLWDTKTDVARTIDEFHEAYYGTAARPMRAYFYLLHDQVRGSQHIWIFNAPVYSPVFLRAARDLFHQAEEAAASDPAVLKRVRKAKLSTDYVELLEAKRFEVRSDSYEPADLPGLGARFRHFMEDVRSFGIVALNEGRELALDEAEFATRIKAYPISTVQSDKLRVDVAPGLEGRIVRIIDKRTGTELLRPLDTGEARYPNRGGLTAFVHPDFSTRLGGLSGWSYLDPAADSWIAKWNWEGDGVMRGVTSNGLELRREIRVDSDRLRTTTTVTNRNQTPLTVAIRDRGEFSVPEMRLKPEGLSNGSDPCPVTGEWHVSDRITARAGKGEVARCSIDWSIKGPPRTSFTLWSEQRALAPGEKLSLSADYEIGAEARSRQ